MYNMCIELEDDIFNMIELFARDKTLRIFVSDRYCWSSLFSECLWEFRELPWWKLCLCLVTLVKSQSPQGLDMFQPLLESIRIRIEVWKKWIWPEDYMSLKNETKEKKGNKKRAIFSTNSWRFLRFQTLEIFYYFYNTKFILSTLRDTPHKNIITKFWTVIFQFSVHPL